MSRALSLLALATASAALVAGCRGPESNEVQAEAQTEAPQAPAVPRVSLVNGSGQCDTPTTPFCDAAVALPPGWTGNVFKLAQDFPANVPADDQPWLAFDPATQPDQYIKSVLAYFYEGNIRESVENSFDPALNTRRQWYNAPWQDYGFNGREPAHGLTRERVNLPGELDPKQTKMWNNYAVGFYNSAGASAIGKVWADHGDPDTSLGIMPEGTVGAKLLFTTATPDEVPYLAGAPTWKTYIYTQVNARRPDAKLRGEVPVRLLQIDIAVKDKRSPTGWVFGTFVYGGGPAPGTVTGAGWTNVSPVGLMWGNDPGYDPNAPGARLKESWINPAVKMPHLGYQGRLNGPVDNPESSCLSCHSTAQDPLSTAPMFPPQGADVAHWFRNIKSGQLFTPPGQSLDYSLQVAFGIQNFDEQTATLAAPAGSSKRKRLQAAAADPLPPRDGATSH
ncbi:MAG TPA: hypothetical protein VFP12_02250 [Allosphingosinicella sp.]|nr:hypothetical protein [Allosphingosinicella sp.]